MHTYIELHSSNPMTAGARACYTRILEEACALREIEVDHVLRLVLKQRACWCYDSASNMAELVQTALKLLHEFRPPRDSRDCKVSTFLANALHNKSVDLIRRAGAAKRAVLGDDLDEPAKARAFVDDESPLELLTAPEFKGAVAALYREFLDSLPEGRLKTYARAFFLNPEDPALPADWPNSRIYYTRCVFFKRIAAWGEEHRARIIDDLELF